MRLTELHVQEFKSLVDAKIPLRPLMVMIGPNGSGKTALLEVFQLLQRGAQGELTEAITGLGGLSAVLSKLPSMLRPNLRVALASEFELNLNLLHHRYLFELVPHGKGYVVDSEQLVLRPVFWTRNRGSLLNDLQHRLLVAPLALEL